MVLEKVKAILAEQFDVEEDKITADTDLPEDLCRQIHSMLLTFLCQSKTSLMLKFPMRKSKTSRQLVHSFLTSRLTHNLLLFFRI